MLSGDHMLPDMGYLSRDVRLCYHLSPEASNKPVTASLDLLVIQPRWLQPDLLGMYRCVSTSEKLLSISATMSSTGSRY